MFPRRCGEGKGTAGWMAPAEEEYFNMLSFVLVPTHGCINSTHMYVLYASGCGRCVVFARRREGGREEEENERPLND